MTPAQSAAACEHPASSPPYLELIERLPVPDRDRAAFREGEILSVQVDPARRVVRLRLRLDGPVSREALDAFRKALGKILPDVQRLVVDVHYAPGLLTLPVYFDLHRGDLMAALSEEADFGEGWLYHCRLDIRETEIVFHVPHRLACETLERRHCGVILSRMLKERCGHSVRVLFVVGEVDAREVHAPAAPPPKPSAEEAPLRWPARTVVWGKNITSEPSPLSKIQEEQNGFTAEGEVVDVEERVQKSGRRLVRLVVTDYTDSVEVKFFHEGDGKYKGGLKPGDWVRVRGDLRFDKFSMDLVLMARDIVKVPSPERHDTAPLKRVELHCHTQMSRMDGLNRVEQLVERAAQWGHPALAITDHGVVQAYPEAKAAAKKHGIKLILGMEGYLVDEYRRDKNLPIYHIILLVKNRRGLKNLYHLVTESHLKYFYRKPLLPRALLSRHREGLILGTACEQGEAWQTLLKGGKPLDEVLSFYDYVEIQPPANNEFMIREGLVESRVELEEKTRALYEAGKRLGKIVVGTGDSHFLEPKHEVYRRIIHTGMGFGVERQAPLFFKTTDELLEDFAWLGEEVAREVVVTNTRKVADWVEDVEPIPSETLSPHWEGAEDQLRDTAIAEAERLYGSPLPPLVEKRLKRELDAIIGNHYATLYVIAMKLVKKSLEDGYLVGSRGSVGSSLVARLCGITEVNPLPPHWRCIEGHYVEFAASPAVGAGVDLPEKDCPRCGRRTVRDGFNIAFEVFMGFQGDKMPDIDLNFSGEYQARAHKYVEELFGKEHCFRAGTISAVKDRIAFGFVKKFLEGAGRQARHAEVTRLVKGCSGVAKTTGQHPGGIVILPKDLEITDVCPVQYPADAKDGDVITTHFDYNSMHDCLVKLDVLGHDNPTSLRRLQDLTGVDPTAIPLDDPATMKLFSGTETLGLKRKIPSLELGTLGVPEFGTAFAMGMLKDTRPTRFEDLVRLSGLAHGTDVWLGNAQDLIRSGVATLSTVISTRDDMLNDLVARGMDEAQAFKIMEAVRKGKGLQPDQEEAMRQAGVPDWYVISCRKIKYIFPKAHAVAYCLMSFRIAYFKVHHPLAFYADYFTRNAAAFSAPTVCGGPERVEERLKDLTEMQTLGKATAKEMNEMEVLEVAREMYVRGFRFLPVDVYRSDSRLFLVEDGAVRAPLVSLPGLGESAAAALQAEREKGPFRTLEDVVARCGVNKNVAALLKEHGGLVDLPETNQTTLF